MNNFYEWRDAPPAQYAVIGDPINHSLSPLIQNAAFKAAGIEAIYTAVRVPESEFEEAIDRLKKIGYVGLNVTVPLKERAFRWAVNGQAEFMALGSLNTLLLNDRSGTNTDVLAMEAILQSCGTDNEDRPAVLILGAGGTARALIAHLSRRGYKVAAWNRTRQTLMNVVEQTRSEVEMREVADPTGCQFIINATSSSLNHEKIPVLWGKAPQNAVAIDCYYSRSTTVFEHDAQENSVAAMNGIRLLVGQGAKSFEWWTGIPAPIDAMLDAINEDRATD